MLGLAVWRAIGLDCEGVDFSAGSRPARQQFSSPARDDAGVEGTAQRGGGGFAKVMEDKATDAVFNSRG
jgi:hypothetical protein